MGRPGQMLKIRIRDSLYFSNQTGEPSILTKEIDRIESDPRIKGYSATNYMEWILNSVMTNDYSQLTAYSYLGQTVKIGETWEFKLFNEQNFPIQEMAYSILSYGRPTL